MRQIFRPSVVLAVALLAAILVAIFARLETLVVSPYLFEVKLATSSGGQTQVYYDTGAGFSETSSVWQPIAPSTELKLYRWPLPVGTYRALRFDPVNGAGTATFAEARVTRRDGSTVLAFAAEDFVPQNQIASLERKDGRVSITTTPGATDPNVGVTLRAPLVLTRSRAAVAGEALRTFAVVFLGGLAVLAGAARLFGRDDSRAARSLARTREYFRTRPQRLVFAVSAVAVAVSCYPVLFLGRSFVSPNYIEGTTLLYGGFPTLPGYTSSETESSEGSDVGALAWHHHPISIIQHRALFRDHELPLWNRYNSTGVTLLGQGQSMFGDPLHLITVIANGAAWAWDVKFVLAKWLFAAGLGFFVLRSTGRVPAALVTSVSAPFIGFFLYRVDHPAIFSMCYAPWILVAWHGVVRAEGTRNTAGWLGALILANWIELTSGTAKEAYVLLLGLNLTGSILLLGSTATWRVKLAKLAGLGVAGVLFAMISSPVWVTFYDALRRAYTTYNTPVAFQIHPTLLLGLFDEIFYRPIHEQERVFNPSANFLVLAGVLYLLATFRQTAPDRMRALVALAALVPLAIAFGAVPPQWIVAVPFIGNVAHTDNCFSCVLIIHLIILAGYGYKAAADRLGTASAAGDLRTSALLLAALLFPWIALTQTVHRAAYGPGTVVTFLNLGQRLPVSPFVWGSLVALLVALGAFAFATRSILRAEKLPLAAAIVGLACMVVMLWRHGEQGHIAFDKYVFNPPLRVDLLARSPAITHVRTAHANPYRTVGMLGNLVPGWSAVYGVETISGPDSIVNAHYRELSDACGLERIWDWRVFVRPEAVAALRAAYDFFGVRYYLGSADDASQLGPTLPPTAALDLTVFTSGTAWPRAFFTDRLAVYDAAADMGRLVRNGDGHPFAAIQSVDRARAPAMSPDLAGRVVVPAKNYRLTNNSTAFSVTAPGPGIVVLQEAWLKGDFRVRVDGKTVDYFRVNHAFKGVRVDRAGTYRIEFSYWPKWMTPCLALATTGLIAIAAGGWWIFRRFPPGVT